MAIGIKSRIDKQSLQESKQLFTEHLKDLQRVAEQTTIKVDIKQSSENLNKIKDSVKGIENTTSSASEGFKGLGSSMETIGSFYAKWASITTLINGTINAIKGGISEISQLDSANVRIAMIQNSSVENVAKMNGELMEMSKRLGELSSQTLQGFESWSRSGLKDTSEINKNLETTAKLARVAGEDQGKMADSLIVIKNGWDLSAEGLKEYASNVAKLDNSSATSSKKINDAMTASANTFREMSVDSKTALSWITAYSEKTNLEGNAIGMRFRNIMLNIRKIQDDVKNGDKEQTDAVNKLEQKLSNYGIYLRRDKDHWRDVGSIIQDIQKNVGKMSEIDLADISFKLGGKENQEAVLSTIRGMERIKELQNDLSKDKNGEALDQAHSKYINSIEYKVNNLKNNVTSMWMGLINSSFVKSGIDDITKLIQMLSWGVNEGRSFILSMGGLALVIKNFSTLKAGVLGVVEAFRYLKAFGLEAFSLLNFNPVMLSLTAIATITALVASEHAKMKQKMEQDVSDLKSAYESLGETMKNNTNFTLEDKNFKKLEEEQKKIDDIKKSIVEAKTKMDEFNNSHPNMTLGEQDQYGKLSKKVEELTNNLNREKDVVKESGLIWNESTQQIQQYADAKNKASLNSIAKQIQDEVHSQFEQKQVINQLWKEYQQLNGLENKNADVKIRMGQISERLKGYISDVSLATDEQGNKYIINNGVIQQRIGKLNQEGLTEQSLTKMKLEEAKKREKIDVGLTKMTFEQVNQRISKIQEESRALLNQRNNTKIFADATGDVGLDFKVKSMNEMLDAKKKEYDELNEGIKSFNSAFDNPTNNNSLNNLDFNDSGYTPKVTDDGKKEKKEKEEKKVEDLKILIDFNKKYKDSLELVGIEIEKNDKKIGQTDNLQEKIRLEKNSLDLLKQRSQLTDEAFQNNIKAEKASRELLESNGFIFDNNGVIQNIEILQQKTEEINKTTGKIKEEGIQHIRNLETEIGKHTNIRSEMAKNRSAWLDLNAESLKHKKNVEDIAKTMREDVKKSFDEIIEKAIFNGKTLAEEEKSVKNITDSIQNEIDSLNEKQKLEKENLEYSKKKEELSNLEDRLEVIKLNRLDKINRERAKELGLLSEREKALEYQEEKSKIEQKLNILNNNTLKNLSDEQSKLLDLQDLKERALERENDLREKQKEYDENRNKSQEEFNKKIGELEEKKKNLINQKNIMTYGKTDKGTFDMFYSVDQEALDSINKDIKETTDDFNKSMQEKADRFNNDKLDSEAKYQKELNKIKEKLNDDLKKKEQDYSKWLFELKDSTNDALKAKQAEFDSWLEENEFNKNIESLQRQQKFAEDSFNIKKELFDNLKNLSESELVTNKDGNLYSIIDKGFSTLSLNTKTKFKGVLDGVRDSIESTKKDIDRLMNDMSNINTEDFKNNGELSGNWADASETNRVKNSFDEKTYLKLNPDVAEEIQRGSGINGEKSKFSSGYEHYEKYGQFEGRQIAKFDDGGFTGSWGSEGKMAILHEKEWVGNKIDTNNLLKASEALKNISMPNIMNNMINRMIPSFKVPDMVSNISRQPVLEGLTQQITIQNIDVKDGEDFMKVLNNYANEGKQFINNMKNRGRLR